MQSLKQLETVGVGISYQDALRPFYRENRDRIDFIEVPAIPGRLRSVDVDGFRTILHSIHLSPLSASPLEPSVVASVLEYVDRYATPWWSEHLSFYKVPGHDTQFILPPIKTPESLRVVCEKIDQLTQRVGLPFILENTPDHFQIPLGTMSDGEFISEVCRRTGTGLLLDLNHAHITAGNRGSDPLAYLRDLPLDQVVEIHVAGSKLEAGILWDAHEEPLKEEIFEMLDVVLTRGTVRAITLECTAALPADVLRGELDRLRGRFYAGS